MVQECPNCGQPVELLDVEFNFSTGIVKAGERECKLRKKLIDLLEVLIDEYPRPVSLDKLFEECYGHLDADSLPQPDVIRVSINVMNDVFQKARMSLHVVRMSKGRGTSAGYILISQDAYIAPANKVA